MVSMLRTTAEKSAERERYESPVAEDDYPSGLEIYLGELEVEKLGSPALDVGGEVMVMARARVESISSEQVNGAEQRRVRLQITEMDLGPASPKRTQAATLYGGEA